jgi:hypothetical protein
MAGFMVTDSNGSGFDIEIRVRYREHDPKVGYRAPTSDELCTALTNVYARAFQEVSERLGDPPIVSDLEGRD